MRAGSVLTTGDEATGTRREAEVLEVLGPNAGPPFLVRWLDTGGTSVVDPDSDVWIEPVRHVRVPAQGGNRCG